MASEVCDGYVGQNYITVAVISHGSTSDQGTQAENFTLNLRRHILFLMAENRKHFFLQTNKMLNCLKQKGCVEGLGNEENIQGIHKRMVQFQKLTRNLFLTLHGHNVQRHQRQLSKFLMRYQQFAFRAYCGASFQDGVAAGKSFVCAPF